MNSLDCANIRRIDTNQYASKDLITVFEGSPAEAHVLQVVLEAQGIYTYLANEIIKTIDPFITGAGMFSLALQVPRAQADEALNVLREIRKHITPDLHESLYRLDPEISSETTGCRLRWLAIGATYFVGTPFFAWALVLLLIPLFTFLFVQYVVRVNRLDIKPRAHFLTLSSGGLMLIFTAILILSCLNTLHPMF